MISKNKLKTASSINIIIAYFEQISRESQLKITALFFTMILNGLAEMISLGAVIPFIGVITSPERIKENLFLSNIVNNLSSKSNNEVVIIFTGLFILAVSISGALRLFNLWFTGRISAFVGAELGKVAYTKLIHQPYKYHLTNNSSESVSILSNHLARTVSALNAFLVLVTSIIISAGILLGLIIFEWKIAIIASIVILPIYFIVSRIVKMRLVSNSYNTTLNAEKIVKIIQEAIGGIRDVIIDGTQSYFIANFEQNDLRQRKLGAENVFLSSFPRYMLEIIGMILVAIMGMLLYINSDNPNSTATISTLGVIALASQRLLPSLQLSYQSWSEIKFSNSHLISVLDIIRMPAYKIKKNVGLSSMEKSIVFKNVFFKYTDNSEFVFKDLNFRINNGESIGICGKSGYGKSTLIDLIIGLLKPNYGSIFIDEQLTDVDNYSDVPYLSPSSISHVPQNIYLADTTIAENIAFGIPFNKIDFEEIKCSAKKAQIHSFIETLPNKYNTFVGENGILLSGGQRQRIGIARALYKKTSLLILDEATSALDSETEKKIISTIQSDKSISTLIMIAHRLSTLEYCDKIMSVKSDKTVEIIPKNNGKFLKIFQQSTDHI
ncbi:ABC transporter ATP-binding protein [Synechococcus sp. CBW1107]|uniref:ABC transporter ATP-binding protein n=1 Tax=Synechococcus sp. CBW1107 TaxID=2789857 RepID=UPI002AD2AC8D|nr:ABC transporter ATP-binding protein [Synechococcus sp. CBW1107]CAK6687431.1 Protein glycosylation K [Synechococcus sp. CBW1107]